MMKTTQIFSLLALVLLFGCTEWKNYVVELGLKGDPKNHQEVAPLTTKCCWCTKREGWQNEVAVYRGADSCESQSVSSQYVSCRPVDIIGNNCNQVDVQVFFSGDMVCKKKALVFMENGMKNFIQPPTGPVAPCDTAQLQGLMVSDSQKQAMASGEWAPPETYCTCGKDMGSPDNCIAEEVSPLGRKTFASERRFPKFRTCSYDACMEMFKERFGSQCSQYIHGTE